MVVAARAIVHRAIVHSLVPDSLDIYCSNWYMPFGAVHNYLARARMSPSPDPAEPVASGFVGF